MTARITIEQQLNHNSYQQNKVISNIISRIDSVQNTENKWIMQEYHKYLIDSDKSEHSQRNTMKLVLLFSDFLQIKYGNNNNYNFLQVKDKQTILEFLDSRKKSKDEDPEQKWITTWNDYLHRIVTFYRWLYNYKLRKLDKDIDEWETPEFLRIKPKKTKRLSPYSEADIWTKNELLTIVKYEPQKRNKAVLTLMWDLNARPHELTLLRIKNIRLNEKYGEGEIPHQAKTGSGPILLTISFPYVRDWLNEHPFRNEPNARLICNLNNGAPIDTLALWRMMGQLRDRISRLVTSSNEIKDPIEKEKLQYLLNTKKWNPYCLRHSSITSDSDFLPEYALKKKVRWSMNSRQGSRYIKTRMGNELVNKILEHNGIVLDHQSKLKEDHHHQITNNNIECPRCQFVCIAETKYCSKCSYPLTIQSYEELKEKEDEKIRALEQRLDDYEDIQREGRIVSKENAKQLALLFSEWRNFKNQWAGLSNNKDDKDNNSSNRKKQNK
jgi:hypothetical protein